MRHNENVMSWDLLERHSIFVTESGCRLWTGTDSGQGYGVIRAGGKLWFAHRAAMMLDGHDIEGLCVLHKCDTPACINSKHLFVGTRSENMADRDRKARVAHGSKHYKSKLTEEQIQAIRADTRFQRVIAADYGIGQDWVSRIKANKAWRRA